MVKLSLVLILSLTAIAGLCNIDASKTEATAIAKARAKTRTAAVTKTRTTAKAKAKTTATTTTAAAATTTAAAANPGDCTLTVPPNPLTAKGLATPYILMAGNCDQTNPNEQVFVEATVFDPATGTFSVYHPLVINQGTRPAAAPIVPTLPAGAVIGIWFGANANTVTLQGDIGTCVNGLSNQDVFGQVAYCNAKQFFAAVNAAKNVVIPNLGVDVNGKTCPTTRSFGIVDQDQSDNLITTYLMTGNKFAQNTKVNRGKLSSATVLSNGSDNSLVADFIDPAIGCKSFKAPSLMEKGVMLGAMALNELHASRQGGAVAHVPSTDPMVMSNNAPSLAKLNLYRQGVNQPVLRAIQANSAKNYCNNLNNIGPQYLMHIKNHIANQPSPMPSVASNLLTFMGQRYAASWTNLGCDKLLMKTSAITTTAINGIATAIQFNQSKSLKKKRKHHRGCN